MHSIGYSAYPEKICDLLSAFGLYELIGGGYMNNITNISGLEDSGINVLLSEFMVNLSARKMRPKTILVQNAQTFEHSKRYIVFQGGPEAKNASIVKGARYTISASCSSLIFSLHIFRITS